MRSKILNCTVWFLCCLCAVSLAFGQASRTQLPPHPRDLQYPPLQYSPPKASAYRQVLNNGVMGFFVEDHDLPLINISVLIRVGTYLDPAGKEGLAPATGSQMRSGGPRTTKPIPLMKKPTLLPPKYQAA